VLARPDPTRSSRPQLKEHPEKGVYVRGLSMHTVHSVAQCERIMDTGWKNRSVGYTLMNKDSSRSHSIFTISIEIYAVGTWATQPEPASCPASQDPSPFGAFEPPGNLCREALTAWGRLLSSPHAGPLSGFLQ
jgi:hypothetical protein